MIENIALIVLLIGLGAVTTFGLLALIIYISLND